MKKAAKKNQFNDLTPIEILEQQRLLQQKADYRRYIIRKTLGYLRTIALIALGIWGYMTRDTIREFILNIFTNPKLTP